jgi:hypothetical protein
MRATRMKVATISASVPSKASSAATSVAFGAVTPSAGRLTSATRRSAGYPVHGREPEETCHRDRALSALVTRE